MNLNNALNFLGYSIPIAGLAFIMWGPDTQALNERVEYGMPSFANAKLGFAFIQPIPKNIELNEVIVSLGEKLFSDPRMSEKNISCISCHNLNLAGNDDRKVSVDINGGDDLMNTPTIFNVGLNPLLTWYGHDMTLEDHVDNVLANKKHMNGNWENILTRLRADPSYVKQFMWSYRTGLTRENVKHAIATFERSLTTPDSAFDNFLRGDETAISHDQKEGFKLFQQYGCISCHQGINVGGNLHAKLGTFTDPFDNDESAPQSNFTLGRYNITNEDDDKYVFRVPSLRNVEQTAPYFHSGDINDLEEAIVFMARCQLGREIDAIDAGLIADFLRSLTGKYQDRAVTSVIITKDLL